MRRIVLVLAALALTTAAFAQTDWQITTADNVATVEMPGTAQYTAEPKTSSDSPTYTMHQYLVEAGDRAYVVQTAVYPSSTKITNPKLNLQNGIDNAAKGMQGGKWENVRWLKHQGLQAVEAVGIDKDGNAIRNYSLLKGNRIIALTFAGPPGSALGPDANRFVGSLKVR